jgi:hypothetical protein
MSHVQPGHERGLVVGNILQRLVQLPDVPGLVLSRPIVGVELPLGMLVTAVSRHRRLRWQLCQLG